MGRGHILLATCNGAQFLPNQLDSLAGQSIRDWDMTASDDGSRDDSAGLLHAFAARMQAEGHDVTLRQGPGRGFAAHFLDLIAGTPKTACWLALSDQDDVWLPDRLARGLAALSELPDDRPALYCSRTWIVEADLGRRRLSAPLRHAPGFRNALVQNIASSNTTLLNRAAADLARAAAPEAASVPGLAAHDWWLYQLITGAGGQVVHDPEPTLLYRQHGGNQIGANDGWKAQLYRIGFLLSGRFAAWNSANIAALSASAERLTAENRQILRRFAALRDLPLLPRLREMAALGLYRQGRLSQAALWLALVLGRL
ncbi:MAG: glycosyltransferase [Paracoccaceae bacterium]|nr:glycosyltransferase [Paracoccaceae bacterium]